MALSHIEMIFIVVSLFKAPTSGQWSYILNVIEQILALIYEAFKKICILRAITLCSNLESKTPKFSLDRFN